MNEQTHEELQAIRRQLELNEQRTKRKLVRIEALLWVLLSLVIFVLTPTLGPGVMIFMLIAGFIIVAIITLASGPQNRRSIR